MADHYQKYPGYKDSGIEWLGQLPSHWGIVNAKWLFPERNIKALKTDKQLTASQKHGVIYQEDFMALEGQKVVQVFIGSDILKHVEPNDFVISMRSFQGGIEYCAFRGCVSSAYVPLVPKPKVCIRFFRYLLKCGPYIQGLQSTTNLVRDGQALRYGNFTQVQLPDIPQKEQEKIAQFLDFEIPQIDTLIDKQQQLIKLLKEKRQAVISHAVTKGLNPAAPMKDSSVEWLGEVPEHWEVKKISHIAVLRSGDGITSEQIEAEGAYPVYGGNGLRGYCEQFNLDGDYVLIGRQGALCGNINYGQGKFWASEHAIVVYPIKKIQHKWLGETLRAMDLNQYSVSAAQPGLSVSNVTCLKMPFPPQNERSAIESYIDEQTRKIDILVRKAFDVITLMQERRTALISAAVTGKIDVSNWQPAQTKIPAEASV